MFIHAVDPSDDQKKESNEDSEKKDAAAETGDTSDLSLWTALMIVALRLTITHYLAII